MNNEEQVEKFIEAYNHLFGLFELTPEPVLVSNKDGLICYGNSIFIKLFGYDASEIVGKPIDILIPERYRSQHPGFISMYCKNPYKRSMGTDVQPVGIKKNGEEIFLDISLAPIGEGLVLCVIRDVSESIRTQNSKLQHTQLSTLGILTSGLIHELSNPLQSISFSSELIKTYVEKSNADPYITAKIEDVCFAAKQLTELVNSFRVLLSAEEAENQLEGSISTAIDAANRLCSHKLTGVDVLIKNNLDSEDNVPMSTNKLAQILINLYANASYAMLMANVSKPQLITEIGKDTNASHIIKVSDNGPGVPENISEKIFDLMFTTKPTIEGTGLGLHICREMLQKVDGQINLIPGDLPGACFEIRFPV